MYSRFRRSSLFSHFMEFYFVVDGSPFKYTYLMRNAQCSVTVQSMIIEFVRVCFLHCAAHCTRNWIFVSLKPSNLFSILNTANANDRQLYIYLRHFSLPIHISFLFVFFRSVGWLQLPQYNQSHYFILVLSRKMSFLMKYSCFFFFSYLCLCCLHSLRVRIFFISFI